MKVSLLHKLDKVSDIMYNNWMEYWMEGSSANGNDIWQQLDSKKIQIRIHSHNDEIAKSTKKS